MTGSPAGSPLSGTVFEVYSTTGNLVDRMVSDAKGVAASQPIPIANTSSSALEDFYIHDRLPTDAVRGNKVFTGTWSDRLTYRVTYKTNYSGDYRVLASGLSTKTNYELSIHPNVLGLANGEYVTDIRWEFGTVPSGFKSVENPKLMVQVLPTLPGDYKIVNRADAGGLYIGAWETAQTSWLTTVIGGYNPPALPKTGY